jgi:transposase
MDQTNYVGIDVSARTLDVARVDLGMRLHMGTFANTPTGHRQLIQWITKRNSTAKVCLEATGLYSLEVALALHHHPRTEVMVVNPKGMKDYAGARRQRAKTDVIDAQLIVDYVQRMPFVPWQPPSEEVLQLQAITRRISHLKVEITRETNRLHAEGYRAGTTDLIAHDIQLHIRYLERRIDRLATEALALVLATPALSTPFERLLSVPGIGHTSALSLLAELVGLPADMSPPQWVAYAGLDPRARESGTSVRGVRTITKAGNVYLRAALYMPALVAIRHQSQVNAFHAKLIAAGKKPLQAIVAVMRKLLHAIWGIWKYDQDFDGEKFYKIAA